MILDTKLIPDRALRIIYELKNSGFEAYLVGGCVRDMLLGNTPNDWDICTNARPDDIIKVAKQAKLKFHTVGIDYGTVNILVDSEEYEVTTFRGESEYSDGRHPDKVNYIDSIHDDLKRRDFTINAIAYDPISGIIVDDFDGQKDLKAGIIRSVGKASERFDEDSLRILRALRFAIRFQFEIDEETSLCMNRQRGLLVNVSKERITAELEKMLTCGQHVKPYFMEYRNILGTILPEIVCCFDFWQNNKYHKHDVYEHILSVVDGCKSNKFEIKLAALLHDIGKPASYVTDDKGQGHFYGHPEVSWEISGEILKNDLRLTREQSERVLNLVRYHDISISYTKGSMKRALNKHGIDMLEDWFILKQADMDDHVYENCKCDWFMNIPKLKEGIHKIVEEQSCFSLKDLNINGYELMKELGLKPGKQIGEILQALLNDVIDEKLDNDYLTLLTRATEFLLEANKNKESRG